MDPEQAVKLYRRGQDLWDGGQYEAAAETLKQAAQKTERQIDDTTSPAKRKELGELLLEIRDWCATALNEVGNYRDAVVYNRRNLEARIHSTDYGPDSEDTLDNRRRLVENYTALGQYDLAITECRNILKVVDGSPDRNSLAQSLFRKGGKKSMQEAVNINLYTLKRDETLLGKSDFSLCKARHNLGVELCELEKFEDARTFLSENVLILDRSSRSDSSKERSLLLRDSREALARCAEMEAVKRASEKKAEEEAERRAQEEKARLLAAAALERERLERERVEQERRDKKRRLEQEALLKARLEEERIRVERLQKRRERLENERKERSRLEEERKEKELQERKEAERKEKKLEEGKRKEKEQKEQEQKEQERKERERKTSEKKEQERKASDKNDQEEQKRSSHEKKQEQPSQDANPRKRHVGGSEIRRTTPEPPKASPKKPSITSQPAAPISGQKHKRTTSEPSKQGSKARSTHSATSSSLQDVRDPFSSLLAVNSSKASGRRRSTSDIASLNTNERPPSAAKSTASRKVASDLPAEPKASTSSTIEIPTGVPSRKYTKSPDSKPALQSDANREENIPKRRVSSSSRLGSDSASSIGKDTTNAKDQKRSNRRASAQSVMPGSWPTDINDIPSITKVQPHHSTGDIPRITYDSVDVSNQTRRTHSNETLRDTTASLGPEKSLSRASSVGHRQRPSSVGGNLFGSVDPNSPG